MMARTQITLDPETQRRARERAADLGISFAEYVRTLVERDLERPRRNGDPSVVFDLGRSNAADVARNKDAMLGAAVEAERSRKTLSEPLCRHLGLVRRGGLRRSQQRAGERELALGESLLTTDHILVETWLLLRFRLHRTAAEKFWEGLRGGVAAIEPVNAADLESAWAIGLDFPDQDFSIANRTSFAVMLRLGVHRAAALDDDFAVFRFGKNKSRAFEIVR